MQNGFGGTKQERAVKQVRALEEGQIRKSRVSRAELPAYSRRRSGHEARASDILIHNPGISGHRWITSIRRPMFFIDCPADGPTCPVGPGSNRRGCQPRRNGSVLLGAA